jgi:5'(3')-deoxyribonucleotidase
VLTIALDFDDVVADLVGNLCRSVNERFGTSHTHDDIRGWDTGKFLAKEHFDWAWSGEAFQNKEWTLTIPPVDGANKGVDRLTQLGHELVIVSSNLTEVPRYDWIRMWLAQWGFPRMEVITTGKGESKGAVAAMLAADLAVDDAPHNIEDLAPKVPKVILFDRPWNQEVPTGGRTNIKRVWNWDQLVDVVRRRSRYLGYQDGPGEAPPRLVRS